MHTGGSFPVERQVPRRHGGNMPPIHSGTYDNQPTFPAIVLSGESDSTTNDGETNHCVRPPNGLLLCWGTVPRRGYRPPRPACQQKRRGWVVWVNDPRETWRAAWCDPLSARPRCPDRSARTREEAASSDPGRIRRRPASHTASWPGSTARCACAIAHMFLTTQE